MRLRLPFLFLALALTVGIPVCPVHADPPASLSPSLAGRILSEDVTIHERDIRSEKPHENLLDVMDLYSLSPAARNLRLPHPMVTPQLARSIKEKRTSVPTGEWKRIIAKASVRYNLPEALIAAVIRVESNFQAHAVSPVGAQGAMQIMPSTQEEVGLVDPWNPEQNVMAGCAYLRRQLDTFGALDMALAAYNAGPGSVRKYKGIPPYAETRSYVRRIISSLPVDILVQPHARPAP